MISSYALRKGLGSQFHWEWFEHTPWDKRHELMFSMAAAGVKKMRCRIWPDDPSQSTAGRDHPAMFGWLDELADAGFEFLFSAGMPWPGMLVGGSWQDTDKGRWYGDPIAGVDTIARRYADACVGLEAPNEYDNPGTYSPDVLQPWAAHLKKFCELIGFAWQINPAVNSLPFVGPSFVWDNSAAQVGDLSAVVDVMNCHPYAGDVWRAAHEGPFQRNRQAGMLPYDRPIRATEYGWQVPPRTELAQAVLLPRQYLSMKLAGFDEAYIYAWFDSGQNMGVMKLDADGELVARPAYSSLQKFTSICDDVPGGSPPSSFPYAVSGDVTDVRSMPAWNRDGSVTLWVWREAPLGNPGQQARLLVPGKTHLVSYDIVSGGSDCPKDSPDGIDRPIVVGDDPMAFRIS